MHLDLHWRRWVMVRHGAWRTLRRLLLSYKLGCGKSKDNGSDAAT